MSRWRQVTGSLLVTAVWLTGCTSEPAVEVVHLDVAAGQACALDGMLIASHDGPKAQLLRQDGKRAFYCDATEAFGEWLDPVRRRRVVGLWFQTVDDGPWEAHADGWQAANDLFFVAGSSRMGAMGPTLAPFRTETAAADFMQQYGGAIHRFDEIDVAVVEQVRRQGIDHLTRN